MYLETRPLQILTERPPTVVQPKLSLAFQRSCILSNNSGSPDSIDAQNVFRSERDPPVSMSHRYGLRPSQQWRCRDLTIRPILRYNLLRSKSTLPTSSRKLPGSEQGFFSKARLRRLFGGFVTGVLLSQAWLYYDRRRVQNSFVAYKLVAKEPVSSTASIFHLRPNDLVQDLEKYRESWSKGIWSVQFKQPQIQIVRAYTPLPPVGDVKAEDSKDLQFLIRHDPHGEVSSYLHKLPIGSDIELRGPNIEYELTPDVQQVVFFAGGTGIAPALQIAHTMFEGKDDASSKNKKLHILWASRKREDCLGGVSDDPVAEPKPPKPTWSGLFTKEKTKPKVAVPINEEKGLIVQQLERLKKRHPGQITVEYFVNAEGTWIDDDVVFSSLSRFDDKDFSKGSPSQQEQRQILISGPNGFITYLAGPKEWKNGREQQGDVSKILAHAIAQNPHHVKVWKV